MLTSSNKYIMLHRADVEPLKQKQSFVVAEGQKVHEIMKAINAPEGYSLVSPATGWKIAPSDFLHRHVEQGSTVEMVKG